MIAQLLERVEWGLKREEVLERFRDAKAAMPHSSKNAHIFVFEFESVPLRAVACFDSRRGDKLFRMQLHLGDEEPIPDDVLKKKFDEIKLELTAKYGAPLYEMMGVEMINRAMAQSRVLPAGSAVSDGSAWAPPRSILILTLALRCDGAAQPGIGTGYGDVENDPISKEWTWIRDRK